MNTFQVNDIVGDVVAHNPALSRVFEDKGIDYCCGGGQTLDQACQKKGLDTQVFIDALQESALSSTEESIVDAAAMSLTELADHIVETHHNYLRTELPRLDAITHKVASVHGGKDSRLLQIRETFIAFSAELFGHMMKEEQILFPMVREIENSEGAPNFHCGSLANPIRQMELEHDNAGSALEKFHGLTDGYTPPDWACNTYRAMLDALSQLEQDLHQHIHKENNVLFPRALEVERVKNSS